jgi:hypothetical protein
VFSLGEDRVVLLGKEVDFRQPPMFILTRGDQARDKESDEQEFIQDFVGHCFEGTQKWPPPGSFFSPIVLVRIKIKDIIEMAKGALSLDESMDQMSALLSSEIRDILFDHACILDKHEWPAGHKLAQFFDRSVWMESNDVRDGRGAI